MSFLVTLGFLKEADLEFVAVVAEAQVVGEEVDHEDHAVVVTEIEEGDMIEVVAQVIDQENGVAEEAEVTVANPHSLQITTTPVAEVVTVIITGTVVMAAAAVLAEAVQVATAGSKMVTN